MAAATNRWFSGPLYALMARQIAGDLAIIALILVALFASYWGFPKR